MKIIKLLVVLLFSIFTVIIHPSVEGVYRISDYKIFDDGSFEYTVTVKVENNNLYESDYDLNWNFYTDDTTKIISSNIIWTSNYIAFEGYDPYQPSIFRKGYQRNGYIHVPPNNSFIYTLSYSGPSEYWSFGGGEGIFYGDGNGGAQTPFKDFYVNITLPPSATNYEVIEESSPNILISENPIKLRWIEHDVNGVTDNIHFWGDNLSTDKPIITIEYFTPIDPNINDEVTFYGYIKFPNSEPYIPPYMSFGVEDPLGLKTAIIDVDNNGNFLYKTKLISSTDEGFYLFNFLLGYENETLKNSYVIPLKNPELSYDYFADINYEISLYNHNTTLPYSTDAFLYRNPSTIQPDLSIRLKANGEVLENSMEFIKDVVSDYWSSDINKGVLIGTRVTCEAATIAPFPALVAACGWGIKTVGIGIGKSAFFVIMDRVIDNSGDFTSTEKENAKLIIRGATHTIFFFAGDHSGGIINFKNIADAVTYIGKLFEVGVKATEVNKKEYNQQGNISGFTLQCILNNDEIANFGVGELEKNSLQFTSYSPVDIVVTDPLGRNVSKNSSSIPNAIYNERDFNGDSDIDDRISITNAVRGLYNLDVIPESYASPDDQVTITISGSSFDSTIFLAHNTTVENLIDTSFSAENKIREIPINFWFEVDTVSFSASSTIKTYVELPYEYDLYKADSANISLNDYLLPFSISPELTDQNLNFISERNINFLSDSLLNYYLKTGIHFTLTILYDSLTLMKGEDSLYLIVTDVETSQFSPSSFVLLQNYPNPFNPSTVIKYSIPQAERVVLKVYGILGEEVTTLVNEEKPAGNYEVKFDGSNLSSGVYFYRIQTGSFTDTKKFILIK